jgi:hypothetical protein
MRAEQRGAARRARWSRHRSCRCSARPAPSEQWVRGRAAGGSGRSGASGAPSSCWRSRSQRASDGAVGRHPARRGDRRARAAAQTRYAAPARRLQRRAPSATPVARQWSSRATGSRNYARRATPAWRRCSPPPTYWWTGPTSPHSTNQRFHFLSDRYRELELAAIPDRVEVRLVATARFGSTDRLPAARLPGCGTSSPARTPGRWRSRRRMPPISQRASSAPCHDR